MGIGQVIGGALSGFGEGLEKQSILNAEDARQTRLQEATTAREMALANLNSRLQDDRDANHQAREFAYGTRDQRQKAGLRPGQHPAQGLDRPHQRHGHRGAQAQPQRQRGPTIKSALDLKKELAVAGQTVDHWAVTTDGKMVAFNKQGGVLRYSQNPGSFVPSGESMSDSGGGRRHDRRRDREPQRRRELGQACGGDQAHRPVARPGAHQGLSARQPRQRLRPDQRQSRRCRSVQEAIPRNVRRQRQPPAQGRPDRAR
jgi:hypothetical protein